MHVGGWVYQLLCLSVGMSIGCCDFRLVYLSVAERRKEEEGGEKGGKETERERVADWYEVGWCEVGWCDVAW